MGLVKNGYEVVVKFEGSLFPKWMFPGELERKNP